ncbi:MAG: hypothetical protein J5608_02220 [Alphaproteobacteria bacterium]|nr:hypothetical protein [Alphaproteobacteria bacterium]
MSNPIIDFVKNAESEKHATTNGRIIHAKLQNVQLGAAQSGDSDLIAQIKKCGGDLESFFGENSRPEVPIAGIIHGQFISRRIDRLVVDDAAKCVRILDYKTDVDAEKFRPKYIAQLHEYAELLKQIYPGYKISCYILWLHNWALEQI